MTKTHQNSPLSHLIEAQDAVCIRRSLIHFPSLWGKLPAVEKKSTNNKDIEHTWLFLRRTSLPEVERMTLAPTPLSPTPLPSSPSVVTSQLPLPLRSPWPPLPQRPLTPPMLVAEQSPRSSSQSLTTQFSSQGSHPPRYNTATGTSHIFGGLCIFILALKVSDMFLTFTDWLFSYKKCLLHSKNHNIRPTLINFINTVFLGSIPWHRVPQDSPCKALQKTPTFSRASTNVEPLTSLLPHPGQWTSARRRQQRQRGKFKLQTDCRPPTARGGHLARTQGQRAKSPRARAQGPACSSSTSTK